MGFAPGSPTYIAHVDGSLVDLHLLLSHVCEETCRDKGLSQDGVAGALDQRHVCLCRVCPQHGHHQADILQSPSGARSCLGIP